MADIAGSRISVSSSERVRYEIPQSPIHDEGSNETAGNGTPPANDRSSVSCSGSVRYEIPQSPTSSSGYEIPQSSAELEVTATRSSCFSSSTVEYEVPQFTSQWREGSRVRLGAVPSTASH